MYRTLLACLCAGSFNAQAQLPPLDVEWSAVRVFTESGPNAHISRDPLTGLYTWALLNNYDGADDELMYPFQTDGTDIAPSYPEWFHIGSLDRLVDVSVRDSVVHRIMYHQNIGGIPQDIYWHLDDQVIQHSLSNGDLIDTGYDILVTDEGVYGCGEAETHYVPDSSMANLVKLDLQGNMLWNILWRDPAHAQDAFTSVAVIGDSVYCAAIGQVALFDRITGAFIGTFDPTGLGLSGLKLYAAGNTLYWVGRSGNELMVGAYTPGSAQGLSGSLTIAGQSGDPKLVVDDQGRLWAATNTPGTGYWALFGPAMQLLSSGTLYESIEDLCFVNGKLSITGIMSGGTAYLITGTPQP
jgi:hypothetical protein